MTVALEMPELRIGNLVARLPIVQGGMGVGVSLSSLASAVANAGGIGVLSAIGIGFMRPKTQPSLLDACLSALRAEIRKARSLTGGILGVNIMVAGTSFEREVDIAVEEGVDIVFAGAGLPMDLPGRLFAGAKTKLVPIVSSARAAAMLIRRWRERYSHAPDALVVEGPLAGGHLGFRPEQIDDPAFALERLVPEVIAEVKKAEQDAGRAIPVIAAGGIFTGGDIARFLALGAAGVQMGTRFVATDECDASDAFKQAYVNCEEKDIGIIQSPVGLPGRAIIGRYLESVKGGHRKPAACPFRCIKTCNVEDSPYCICKALIAAQRGNLDEGFVFCGQNAHRVTRVMPVCELLDLLRGEYREAVRNA